MHGHINVQFNCNLLVPINAHSEIYITLMCAFVGIKRFYFWMNVLAVLAIKTAALTDAKLYALVR